MLSLLYVYSKSLRGLRSNDGLHVVSIRQLNIECDADRYIGYTFYICVRRHTTAKLSKNINKLPHKEGAYFSKGVKSEEDSRNNSNNNNSV